jgi:hypothetical protein
MPGTAPRILESIGVQEGELTTWTSASSFGLYRSSGVQKTAPLFPRLDLEIELTAMAAALPRQIRVPRSGTDARGRL